MEKFLPELHNNSAPNPIVGYKNKEAFYLFYDNYSCFLYGLAVKSLKSEELAEKIIELTFIKAWNSNPCHHNTKLSIWLVGVLIATAKAYLESNQIKYILRTENFPDFYFEM